MTALLAELLAWRSVSSRHGCHCNVASGLLQRLHVLVLAFSLISTAQWLNPLLHLQLMHHDSSVIHGDALPAQAFTCTWLQAQVVACLQVPGFVLWSASRFLLYSSFFSICATLFSNQHFGRVTGLISVVAGCIGLIQFGLVQMVHDHKGIDAVLPLDIAAIVWLSFVYLLCGLMYKLERRD